MHYQQRQSRTNPSFWIVTTRGRTRSTVKTYIVDDFGSLVTLDYGALAVFVR